MAMQPTIRAVHRAARDASKSSLRRYGEITSGLRGEPAFVIIGAKRGGTTSLYNYLLEHPSISPLFPRRQRIKGAHYFDSEFARGRRWYRSHFPLEVGDRHIARPWVVPAITGEASPYYLFHPLAAQRLAREVPDVRLIVLLRDPVERAYSHYKERARHAAEPLSFEDALDAEASRLRGEADRIVAEPGYRSAEHEDHSYLAQGRYLDMLPRWFALFPREQFHIVASEDFYADPDRVVNDTWSFLGLAPGRLRSRTRHNYHPAPDFPPETRHRLQLAFGEHNRELEQLLGRALPWPATGRPAGLSSRTWPATPSGEPESASGAPRSLDVPSSHLGTSKWPAVTVVVATRDRPALLERAVRGIMGQSYPGDIECTAVFDQSSPAAVSAQESASRTLRLMTNTRAPGLAGARNSGIAASDAALVAFCDDDDVWDVDKLRLQVERLTSAGAEFAGCGVRIHHNGRVIARVPPRSVDLSQLVRARVTALHPSTFLMRREALDAIGLVDEQIPGSYGEDYDWLLRAARRGPIVAVEQPLVDVYWHEQSFFAEGWEAIEDALTYLLGKHPELTSDRQGLARIQGQIAFAQAAQARRPAARRASWSALRNNPLERRAYLALAVASGLIPAASVVRVANSRGRGI
jgi:Glycosyltransferase like family 2/Sulfotransferase domain